MDVHVYYFSPINYYFKLNLIFVFIEISRCFKIRIVLISECSFFEWEKKVTNHPRYILKVAFGKRSQNLPFLSDFPRLHRIANDWTMTKASATSLTTVIQRAFESYRSDSFVYLFCWRVDKITFLALSCVVFGKLEHIQVQKIPQTKRHYDYSAYPSFIEN